MIKLVMIFFTFFTLLNADSAKEFVGKIKKIKGVAYIDRADKRVDIKLGDSIYQNDIITTEKGVVGVTLRDNTLISLGTRSKVSVNDFIFNPEKKDLSLRAEVLKGTASFLTGTIAKLNKDAMKIKTKTATIGIRGTHFIVEVD